MKAEESDEEEEDEEEDEDGKEVKQPGIPHKSMTRIGLGSLLALGVFG